MFLRCHFGLDHGVNGDGKWLSTQAYESKTECDSNIAVGRERVIIGSNDINWKAFKGDTPKRNRVPARIHWGEEECTSGVLSIGF